MAVMGIVERNPLLDASRAMRVGYNVNVDVDVVVDGHTRGRTC